MSGGGGRSLLIGAAVIVGAAVVAGLLVLGSPQDERARRLDQNRLTDLEHLNRAINLHFYRDGVLPDSLEELARSSSLPVRMTEPEGGRLYDYEVIDSTSYRLCATFNFPTPEPDEARYIDREWAHGAGRQCFRFRVRPPDPQNRPGREEALGPVLEGSPDSSR